MVKCRCGTDNPDNAEYCLECGKKLSDLNESKKFYKKGSILSNHRKKIIIGTIGVISLIAFITFFHATSGIYPSLGLTKKFWGGDENGYVKFEYPKNWVKEDYNKIDAFIAAYNERMNIQNSRSVVVLGSSGNISVPAMVYDPNNPLKFFYVYNAPKSQISMINPVGPLGIPPFNSEPYTFTKIGESQVNINPINSISTYKNPFNSGATLYEYQIKLQSGKSVTEIIIPLKSNYRESFLYFVSPTEEIDKEKQNLNLIINTFKTSI